MCHGYKLASLNWCCQLLPCSDGEKFGLLIKFFEVFQLGLQPQKRAKQSHFRVCRDSWTCSSNTVH